ncbi:hypothetical protein RW693_13680 [Klebsiella pneumoniae]|nr:hypothetical protein [Klebsiella pneumoniae]
MTKSTITRERLEQLADNNTICKVSWDERIELAQIALAAMDSEPVAWKVRFKLEGQPGSNFNKFFENRRAMNDVVSLHELGGFNIDVTPLYRQAQPALVQPVMFIDGDISSEDADKLEKVIREFNEEDERPLAKMARIIRDNPHPTNECDMPKAQPAPVVPDVMEPTIEAIKRILPTSNPDEYAACIGADMWNACRAAMLSGGKP